MGPNMERAEERFTHQFMFNKKPNCLANSRRDQIGSASQENFAFNSFPILGVFVVIIRVLVNRIITQPPVQLQNAAYNNPFFENW